MGRLTEYYQYLQTDPSKITDKKLRRKLKLYKTEEK